MNIQELILAKLKTKFAGVEEAILNRIAEKKAVGVTDVAKVDSIVEDISFSDVLTSYGDFRADGASRTAIANYEKKHNIKDGKAIEDPKPNKPQKPKEDDIPAWAQALIESNKAFSAKLEDIEAAKRQAARHEQIMAKAKEYGIPENYAKRLSIKDDEDLDAYFKEVKQELKNEGFKDVVTPETPEQKIQKNSEELASLINKGTEELNKK